MKTEQQLDLERFRREAYLAAITGIAASAQIEINRIAYRARVIAESATEEYRKFLQDK